MENLLGVVCLNGYLVVEFVRCVQGREKVGKILIIGFVSGGQQCFQIGMFYMYVQFDVLLFVFVGFGGVYVQYVLIVFKDIGKVGIYYKVVVFQIVYCKIVVYIIDYIYSFCFQGQFIGKWLGVVQFEGVFGFLKISLGKLIVKSIFIK